MDEIELYRPSVVNSALNQGELITGITLHTLDVAGRDEVVATSIEFAVIMTGDCDLEQDFKRRAKIQVNLNNIAKMPSGSQKDDAIRSCEIQKHSTLPHVLFCRAFPAGLAQDDYGFKPGDWNTVLDNENERFHFLCESIQAEDLESEGVPPLLLDFKKIFTVPTEEIFHSIATGSAKRRCFLSAPYLQHLSMRFANSLSRVGLKARHWDLSSYEPASKIRSLAESSGDATSLEEVENEFGF